MQEPCGWQLNMDDCADWGNYEQEVRDSATAYATLTLWAATGRRFGLCEVTVRPCGITAGTCSDVVGYISDGFYGWIPYLNEGGAWRSASASCAPRCQVLLPGRVDSIVQVVQDGVTVSPEAYRVDDWRWLVRTDGGCWPATVDLSSDVEPFEVTYLRGLPVPDPLLDAAATLACEWAKGRVGSKDCRLPARITSLSRQGVQMSALDTDSLTRRNFTGIPEVDQVIFALNPRSLFSPPRVYTPDVPQPRQVTG